MGRSIRPSAKQVLSWAGVVAIALLGAALFVLRNAIYFLIVFETSAAACRQEGTVAPIGKACDAAQACTGELSSAIVEQRCLAEARRASSTSSGSHWAEWLVAAHVLWSRESISPDTLSELKRMSRSTTVDPAVRLDLQALPNTARSWGSSAVIESQATVRPLQQRSPPATR